MTDPDLATHEGYLPGSREYRQIVVALFAAGIATFAALYSTQALLPLLADDFRLTTTAASLSLGLATAGLGITLLVAGPVSDVIGRTELIHWSLALTTAVAALCALAPNWSTLLSLRLLEGVTLAGLPAVATAYLREELHPSAHARAAGVYIGGTALGGMVGRVVTGPIGEATGWRWALASSAVVVGCCAIFVRVLLPASRRFTPSTAGARAGAARLRRAITEPGLLALYGIGGCAMGAFVAVFNTIGFRLEGAPFHIGLGAASMVYLVLPVGTVSAVAFGRLADRYSRRSVLPFGCLLVTAGIAVTLVDSIVGIVVGLAVLTAGFFAVHSVSSGWIPARAHASGVSSGQAASLYLFSYYAVSSALGVGAGSVWSSAGWPGVAGMVTVLMMVALGLAGILRLIPQRAVPTPRSFTAASDVTSSPPQ